MYFIANLIFAIAIAPKTNNPLLPFRKYDNVCHDSSLSTVVQ